MNGYGKSLVMDEQEKPEETIGCRECNYLGWVIAYGFGFYYVPCKKCNKEGKKQEINTYVSVAQR